MNNSNHLTMTLIEFFKIHICNKNVKFNIFFWSLMDLVSKFRVVWGLYENYLKITCFVFFALNNCLKVELSRTTSPPNVQLLIVIHTKY